MSSQSAVKMRQPELNDYQNLFKLYPDVEFWKLDSHLKGQADPYLFLFRQMMGLMEEESPFNRTLPITFRETAKRYMKGDPVTTKHFNGPENRYFLLSDLKDWLHLQG
ncbi:hypothetical protein [Magnetococcus sp. PR-3]|uniref:hypothetical protein n=1 Tax=Magnetococcus sp. PR-3 TaxID=3120355 RepID=UPI002FCE0B04